MPCVQFGNIFYFIVLSSIFYTSLPIFIWTQLEALFSKKLNLNYLFLSQIFEAAFVIVLSLLHSSVRIIFFPFKYILLDALILSILIILLTGALMHISIITIYVICNTDNIHIELSYIYCLLHPYLVSYIILSFMNKLFSYIQWMNSLIWSNSVSAFWAESSEKCEWNPSSPFHIYCDTQIYCLLLRECSWIQITLTEFECQVLPSILQHNQVLSSHNYYLPKYHPI